MGAISGNRRRIGDSSNRVNRGGSWNNTAQNVRGANRNNTWPDNRNTNLGFRVASTGAHPLTLLRERQYP